MISGRFSTRAVKSSTPVSIICGIASRSVVTRLSISCPAASISRGTLSIRVVAIVATASTAAGMSVGSASAMPCTSAAMNCTAASTTSGNASMMLSTSIGTIEATALTSPGNIETSPFRSASNNPAPISRNSGKSGEIASRMPSKAFGTVFARFSMTGEMFFMTELKEFTTLSHSLSTSASASPRPVMRF